MVLEKFEEPASKSTAATSGSSNSATAAIPAGAVSSTVAAPGETASGSSAAVRRSVPERGGAESGADLVSLHHLQVTFS